MSPELYLGFPSQASLKESGHDTESVLPCGKMTRTFMAELSSSVIKEILVSPTAEPHSCEFEAMSIGSSLGPSHKELPDRSCLSLTSLVGLLLAADLELSQRTLRLVRSSRAHSPHLTPCSVLSIRLTICTTIDKAQPAVASTHRSSARLTKVRWSATLTYLSPSCINPGGIKARQVAPLHHHYCNS